MQSSSEGIILENVTKLYGYGLLGLRKFKALDSVSLTIGLDKPSVYVIAGETGSGKSTLLKIILGLVKPDDGRVLYRGVDLDRIPKSVRMKELQPVFQDPYETFNPLRRIDSYLYDTANKILKIRDDADKYVDEVLRYVGLSLDKVRGKYPFEFSGGELQRISIARALLAKPRVIIADEPVSMLDASLRVNILNLFLRIKSDLNISTIYVTHDLASAYYVGDNIAVLYRGTIVEEGPIDKVYKDPMHPYTQLLLNSILEPDPRISEKIKPVKLSSIEIKEFLIAGCRFANRCPHAKDICWSKLPPMIDVNGRRVKCWLYAKQ